MNMEQARELAAALASGTFSIELVERLRANAFYVPAGGLVAQAIDFLLEERNRQKEIVENLHEQLAEQARFVNQLREDLARRDTTIRAMRQQLVMAQQRGDEYKERCEGLAAKCNDLEKRGQYDGGGANYWRTQYEKLSQDHEATIEKWRERVNELEERNVQLVEGRRDDDGKVPRFLVVHPEGGARALLDLDYVVAATFDNGYLTVRTLDTGDMVFEGEWAGRVWNELVSAMRYR